MKTDILRLYLATISTNSNGHPLKSFSAHNPISQLAKGSMRNSGIEEIYSFCLLEINKSLDLFTGNPTLPFLKNIGKIQTASFSSMMMSFLKNLQFLALIAKAKATWLFQRSFWSAMATPPTMEMGFGLSKERLKAYPISCQVSPSRTWTQSVK